MSGITLRKIEKMIFVIRGQKVMIDSDLAELYEVETKAFNRAVKRNLSRFPKDFMFQLTKEEFESLRCQIGTSKSSGRGGRRYLPLVFTEHGIAMLSSVLNSERAIKVNISIIRVFIKLRQLLFESETLSERVYELEKGTDRLFRVVFERLDNLEAKTPILPKKRKRIGLKK